MTKHRARQFVACVGVLTVAGLMPAALAGASPGLTRAEASQLLSWYKQDAAPLVTAVSNAATDFGKGKYMQACSTQESVASAALTKPSPPVATVAYHWGAAVAFYIAGAGECVQALQHGRNASELNNAASYINDGNTQFDDVTAAINALARD